MKNPHLLEVRCGKRHGKCGHLLATVDHDYTLQVVTKAIPYLEATPSPMRIPQSGLESLVALVCPKHGPLGPVDHDRLKALAEYAVNLASYGISRPSYNRYVHFLDGLDTAGRRNESLWTWVYKDEEQD